LTSAGLFKRDNFCIKSHHNYFSGDFIWKQKLFAFTAKNKGKKAC